jgi:hypothetical protein
MRSFILTVVGLLALVVLLAGPVVARLAHPRTDCASRVMIVKGLRGEPVECACIEGTLAACLRPGPLPSRQTVR